jgi:hypothetical protein
MKGSLEEERMAILERMDATRRNYRRRFDVENENEKENRPPSVANTFPRSHTFKFVTRHPYFTSLAVLALIAAMPHGSLKKAAKGGAALTAGILRSQVKASVINSILPSVMHMMRRRM